jgi:Protein of unknown function (DUF3105)
LNWDSRTGLLIERTAIAVVSLVLSVGAIALLSGYFAGNDQAGITGAASGPGRAFKDLGDQLLPPGQLQPPYDSTPPTSGAHVSQPVERDETVLTDNQLLTVLSRGNVVIAYGTSVPPTGLRALANSIAGPFTPSLAADGLAVILARDPGARGLIGVAWTHILTVESAADPLLAEFARFWLGKGTPTRSLPAS